MKVVEIVFIFKDLEKINVRNLGFNLFHIWFDRFWLFYLGSRVSNEKVYSVGIDSYIEGNSAGIYTDRIHFLFCRLENTFCALISNSKFPLSFIEKYVWLE